MSGDAAGGTNGPDAARPVSPESPLAHRRRDLADSFGGVATTYDRFRPGPAPEAVAWFVPGPVDRIVDLGAGTGAQTRLLLPLAGEVVAVEPDARMRDVLAVSVPTALAVDGRGEDIPLGDGAASAVLASTSWHWMEPEATLAEVGRVLAPGGTLGASWTGPDREGALLAAIGQVLTEVGADRGTSGGPTDQGPLAGVDLAGVDLAGLAPLADILRDRDEHGDGPLGGASRLVVPDDGPFSPVERREFRRDLPLTADDLVGLLGTFSWIITLDAPVRARLLDAARGALASILGLAGGATVDVTFLTTAYRSLRQG